MKKKLIFAVTFAVAIMITSTAFASTILTEKWLNGTGSKMFLDVFEREYNLPKQTVWQNIIDAFTPFGYSVGKFDTTENVLCMEKYEAFQELIRYIVQFADYDGKTRIRIFKYDAGFNRPINSKSLPILLKLK